MGRGLVRFLTAISVVMGILIFAGTVLLVVVLVKRAPVGSASGAPATLPVVLDEPAGTRIAGASGTADALVLRLTGGGPDRVVVVDARSGRVAARATLAR